MEMIRREAVPNGLCYLNKSPYEKAGKSQQVSVVHTAHCPSMKAPSHDEGKS